MQDIVPLSICICLEHSRSLPHRVRKAWRVRWRSLLKLPESSVDKKMPIPVHCIQNWNSKTWWTLKRYQVSAHTFWWNSGFRGPYFLTQFGLSRHRGNLPLQEVVNRTKVRSPRNTTNVSVYGPLCVSADRSWAGRWCGCWGGRVIVHLLAPMCPVYLTIHTLKQKVLSRPVQYTSSILCGISTDKIRQSQPLIKSATASN